MTTLHVQYRWRCAVAAAMVLALPVARADEACTGREPWYQQSSADNRRRAQALFEKAVGKHQELQRGDARELYEQALALWDNPDIRWNLALVLEDLGEYLLAHQQLSSMLHWKAALCTRQLREVQDRMQALEARHLGRVEVHGEEAGAEIKLDGQSWSLVAGRRDTLVTPGEHYVSTSKSGFFPVTILVPVTMGMQTHVTLEMDADRLLVTRRWRSWKPWVVVASGIVVIGIGAGLEWRALANRSAAVHDLASNCGGLTCPAARTESYDRAVMEHRATIGLFGVGGVAVAVGLTLVWLNHPLWHRSEPRARSTPTFTPILSLERSGGSVLVRF
jgi:hypothetical protein